MSRPRGGANHCSECGALNRTNRTHLEGMTRTEHEKGAISYCRNPSDEPRDPPPKHQSTPPMTRQEAMDAMDEAVRDLVAQEDEAATMAPPTLESDRVEIEMLGARLEYEDGEMFVVFRVGREFFYGRLDKYEPPEFDPLDLIRKEDE